MDAGIVYSIAEDLGVMPAELAKVLAAHNTKLAYARMYYPIQDANAREVLDAPINTLNRFGLSTKTQRCMIYALHTRFNYGGQMILKDLLSAVDRQTLLEGLPRARGVGKGALEEIKALLDLIEPEHDEQNAKESGSTWPGLEISLCYPAGG